MNKVTHDTLTAAIEDLQEDDEGETLRGETWAAGDSNPAETGIAAEQIHAKVGGQD